MHTQWGKCAELVVNRRIEQQRMYSPHCWIFNRHQWMLNGGCLIKMLREIPPDLKIITQLSNPHTTKPTEHIRRHSLWKWRLENNLPILSRAKILSILWRHWYKQWLTNWRHWSNFSLLLLIQIWFNLKITLAQGCSSPISISLTFFILCYLLLPAIS